MAKRKTISIAAFVALALIAAPARAQLAQATLVNDTFSNPVYVTGAPGTPSLLFVVEKAGIIQVLQDEVNPRPFLDIRSRVSAAGERGLLSVAFAPNYAASRLFYVAYTNLGGDIVISEFRRSAANPLRAAFNSERVLLTIEHSEYSNHNGGQLHFGPDGLLYISIGDGGGFMPRGKYARNLRSLLGKILRIDPTPDRTAMTPYTIPADNPYFGTGRRAEIFAYGLRNPWRFSFDGQRIAIGDVGQGDWEEINFLTVQSARGANFGWPAFEGDEPFDDQQPVPPDPPTFPMHVYSQDGGRCAVIGGYVSRDPNIRVLMRRYVYGDYCGSEIRAFIPDVATQEPRGDRLVLSGVAGLTSFGIGPDQRMYFTQNSGELMRIDPLP